MKSKARDSGAWRRKWFPALLLASLGGCGGPTAEPPPLLELQPPALDRFDPEVAGQLSQSYETAAKLVGPPLKSRAEAAEACGRLGKLYLVYELPDAALTAFQDASLLAPDGVHWSYYLGVLRQSRGDLDEAAEDLRRVVQKQPDNLAAWVRLANVEFDQGDDDGAETAYRQALDLEPSAAAAHFGLGRLAARRSDHQTAVKHFEKALQLEPGATQVHYALAQSYRRLGDGQRARDHLAKRGESPVTFPDPMMSQLATLTVGAPGHAHRADQAVLEERFREAAQEYRQASVLAPKNYHYRKSLALTQYRLGQSEAAIQSMREAIELLNRTGPDRDREDAGEKAEPVPAKELSQARYTLGGMLANQGASEMALEEFQRALDLDPDNLDARLQIGRVLGRVGRLGEALHHFQRVVREDPDHAEANRLAATTLMDLGRFAEALPCLHRLVKLEPGNQHDSWLLKVATERAKGK